MRIIAKRTLREFWKSDPDYLDSKGSLESWHDETNRADGATPQEVKAQFGTASILKDSRVVFNIHGNKYRLIALQSFPTIPALPPSLAVVKINYAYRIVYILSVGTHKQYDATDVESI